MTRDLQMSDGGTLAGSPGKQLEKKDDKSPKLLIGEGGMNFTMRGIV